MKRLVLLFCLCGLLAVPALATAGVLQPDNQFQGRVEGDPNTYFGFDVTGSKDREKVRHVTATLPMTCYSSDQGMVETNIPGSFKLRRPRVEIISVGSGGHHRHTVRRLHYRFFYAEADVETPDGSGEAYLYGAVRHHGKARGYIRVQTHSESLGKCYSGGLEWKAKRGANVNPPAAP
jgi:hypothetical protein